MFFMKINILLIFFFLYFFRRKSDMKNFVKILGDELEECVLRLLKISTTHKYIPNRLLMCLHYMFLSILISEDHDDSQIYTCRKIEKKEKHLNRSNLDKFIKIEPKYFMDYEKENCYIEKFYRRNMLKKEKSDIERVVIVNILKILLSTIENNQNANNSVEYIKEFIPESKFIK